MLYDYWYELIYHFVWHNDAGIGLVEWWVDGELIVSKPFPTLFANADGTHSYNTFGLYNYRWHDPNHTSRVDFDLVAIGPTRASVGG